MIEGLGLLTMLCLYPALEWVPMATAAVMAWETSGGVVSAEKSWESLKCCMVPS